MASPHDKATNHYAYLHPDDLPHPMDSLADLEAEARRLRIMQCRMADRQRWARNQAESRAAGWVSPDDWFAASDEAEVDTRRDPYARLNERVTAHLAAWADEQAQMQARGARWDGCARRWRLPDGSLVHSAFRESD